MMGDQRRREEALFTSTLLKLIDKLILIIGTKAGNRLDVEWGVIVILLPSSSMGTGMATTRRINSVGF